MIYTGNFSNVSWRFLCYQVIVAENSTEEAPLFGAFIVPNEPIGYDKQLTDYQVFGLISSDLFRLCDALGRCTKRCYRELSLRVCVFVCTWVSHLPGEGWGLIHTGRATRCVRKLECFSFDVASMQCEHSHWWQQIPFACVALWVASHVLCELGLTQGPWWGLNRAQRCPNWHLSTKHLLKQPWKGHCTQCRVLQHYFLFLLSQSHFCVVECFPGAINIAFPVCTAGPAWGAGEKVRNHIPSHTEQGCGAQLVREGLV